MPVPDAHREYLNELCSRALRQGEAEPLLRAKALGLDAQLLYDQVPPAGIAEGEAALAPVIVAIAPVDMQHKWWQELIDELIDKDRPDWLAPLLQHAPHLAHYRTPQGRTLFTRALYRAREEVADLLLAAGADPTAMTGGRSALDEMAIYGNDWRLIKKMGLKVLEAAGPRRQEFLDNALLASAAWGNPLLTRFVLEEGANPQVKNADGVCALVVGVMEGNAQVVNLLLGQNLPHEDVAAALAAAPLGPVAELVARHKAFLEERALGAALPSAAQRKARL